MGFILSKLWRKKSTFESLEVIEKKINKIIESKKQNVSAKHAIIKYILTYGVVFWLFAMGVVYYVYRTAQRTEDYLILLPLLIVIPLLLFLSRKLLTWWYHKKIIKDDDKLKKLKEEKATILDEVMEKETYKVATQILERFDPGRLNGGKLGGAIRPPGGTTPLRPLDPPGMDVRKRQAAPGANVNTSLVVNPPSTTTQRPHPGLNQTIPSRTPTTGPASQATTPRPGGQDTGPVGGGGGGGGRPRPPLPRPVLPRERGYLDKMVEYLVGDGPSNRYALICRQCQSHNGMALREEFEYISYRCCYCYYWNPARKQRPVAPKLPEASALRSSDPDSSDDSSDESTDNPAQRKVDVNSQTRVNGEGKAPSVGNPPEAKPAASGEVSAATLDTKVDSQKNRDIEEKGEEDGTESTAVDTDDFEKVDQEEAESCEEESKADVGESSHIEKMNQKPKEGRGDTADKSEMEMDVDE